MMSKSIKRVEWKVWQRRLLRVLAVSLAAYAALLVLSVVFFLTGILGVSALGWISALAVGGFIALVLVLSIYTVQCVRYSTHAAEEYLAELPRGFVRFRQRIRRAVWIRTLAGGGAAGLLCAAVCLVLFRRGLLLWHPLYIVLLCVGVACATALLAFFAQYPAERRIARQLDRSFSLNERVQTMLAYRTDRGAMAGLQRADVDERLSAIPLKQLKTSGVWACLIALILSVTLTAGAIFLPVTADANASNERKEEGTSAEPFALSRWQILAMENLIEDVKKSSMEEKPKAETVSLLEALLSELHTIKTVPAMKTAVIAAIVRADSIADTANTHERIGKELKLGKLETATAFGELLLAPNLETMLGALDEICAGFAEDTLSEDVGAFILDVNRALQNTGILNEEPLYAAVYTLTVALRDALSTAETDPAAASEQMDSAFNTFYLEAGAILARQLANRTMADTVVSQLAAIFGIATEEIPPLSNSSAGDSSEEIPRPEVGDHGGLGAGDILYGSNDIIYHPDDNTHIQYGSVLGQYFAKQSEELGSSEMSDEMKAFITKYFDALYSGSVRNDPE